MLAWLTWDTVETLVIQAGFVIGVGCILGGIAAILFAWIVETFPADPQELHEQALLEELNAMEERKHASR